MAEDLCAPGLADEVVMLQNATMRFEFAARLQPDNEMFVTQADQLGKVAVARDGGVEFEGH